MSTPPKLPCTVYRLRMATRRATRLYDRHLLPSGLGIAQFGILQLIGRRRGASITDIAAALDMDRTTLTRNLAPLQRDGLVRFIKGPDRRARALSMTSAGAAAVERALPMWRAAQAALRDSLGADDVAVLNALLDATVARIPDE